MKRFVLLVLIAIVGTGVNWLALLVGWWWVTPVVGLLIGIFLRPAGVGFLASFCAGGLGWGLPLAVLAAQAPVGKVANTVESVIALSATGGALILVLTIVLGILLSVVGTWAGVTGRRVSE